MTNTTTAELTPVEATAKTKWSIDLSHSEIGFKIKHLMISNVNGVFKIFGASVNIIGNDFITSEIDFWMDPASIDTGDEKRDRHLISAEFFDVENHKKITFVGKDFKKGNVEGSFKLFGDLTLKEITNRYDLFFR